MGQLNDKVAIVTGTAAPSGIGAAIARRYAAEGASLLLVDNSSDDSLRAAAQSCSAQPGAEGRVETLLLDLAERGAPERMVEHALALFGRVDVLVNNAAFRNHQPFMNNSRDDFERAVAVNVAAPYFATQAVVPAMRKQGGGRIIHIASQLGVVAAPARSVYSLTKAALISLARSSALELAADGIVVNAISPGPIETGAMVDRFQRDPEGLRQRLAYLPAGRCGQPEEIAEVALFLACTPATFLVGTNVMVDGGYTVH
jgi:NAD(P)-dependent dehydrogenase (short-subunit alcohol dehydrogenase family)